VVLQHDIVVSGSLSEIRMKLQRIKEVIANRVATGYAPKQHDEEWLYHTAQDDRVCPICAPLHGNIYRGDYLVNEFSLYVVLGPEKVQLHYETDFHTHLQDRCTAEWINAHEVLVQRLYDELLEAVPYTTGKAIRFKGFTVAGD